MEAEIDSQTRRRIEDAVLSILKSADNGETNEQKVRALAEERLALDLSSPDRLDIFRLIFNSHSSSSDPKAEPNAPATPCEAEARASTEEGKKELDNQGELLFCNLSNNRKVTLQEFRGRKLVSIREYYEKAGKQLPSAKGISLTPE